MKLKPLIQPLKTFAGATYGYAAKMKDPYAVVVARKEFVAQNKNGIKKAYNAAVKWCREFAADFADNPIKEEWFQYFINLDERGSFFADVRNQDGNTVWETKGEVFEDGFMKHKHDLTGLQKYLKSLKIMPPHSILTRGNPCHANRKNPFYASEWTLRALRMLAEKAEEPTATNANKILLLLEAGQYPGGGFGGFITAVLKGDEEGAWYRADSNNRRILERVGGYYPHH